MTTPKKAEAMAAKISAKVNERPPMEIPFPPGYRQWDPDIDRAHTTEPVLAEKALQGPLGDFLRLVDPHTETSIAAIGAEILAIVGNMLGRSVVTRRGLEIVHRPNLFIVIEGTTSLGGKGLADGVAKAFAGMIDPLYLAEHETQGFQSGEELLRAVRDPSDEDAGVVDQRLVIQEDEFSRLLDTKDRKGSSLGPMILKAFDTEKTLGDRSIGRGVNRSTNHLISIIGSIPPDLLIERTNDAMVASGFANRFLYIHSRITPGLPDGSDGPKDEYQRIASGIGDRIKARKRAKETATQTPEANAIWHEVYPGLRVPHQGGRVGKLLLRGVDYVTRLEMIFAAMEGHSASKASHIEAALAWWDYSAQTVEYVFGAGVGIGKADAILDTLRTEGAPMSRTEIVLDIGKNRITKTEASEGLRALEERQLIVRWKQKNPVGAPTEIATAIAPDTGQLKDNDNNNDQEVGR